MFGRRNWSLFWANVGRECMGPSGWLVGTGLGVGGIALALTGPLGIGLMCAGGAAIAAGTGAGIYRAVPPKRRTAADLNAQKVSIKEVLDLDPPILKFGVVGDTQAGKTTLINRLLQKPVIKQRTQGVGAHIIALQTTPPIYIALIDGGGEEYAQQFRVAEFADVLCVVLDHNQRHDDVAISSSRLADAKEFQRQLLGYIKGARSGNNPSVWLMVNKRDLWEKLHIQDQQPLHDAVAIIEKEWEQSNLAKDVTVSKHSNNFPDDVAAFHERVVQYRH